MYDPDLRLVVCYHRGGVLLDTLSVPRRQPRLWDAQGDAGQSEARGALRRNQLR